MGDLFELSQSKELAALSLLADAIASKQTDKNLLHSIMRDLHGGTAADGIWTQRDAFDFLEAGLVSHLIGKKSYANIDATEGLTQLSESLPTHTVRSEDQIKYQQFSTPIELANLVVLLANPQPNDIVLEPSAGHGLLAALLPPVKQLHLNEIDPKRRSRLNLLFPSANITTVDGAMLTSLLSKDVKPSLIIMNPPFSRSEGRGVDQMAAVRHLRSAIAKAARGARIVAIMPDSFTTSARMMKIYQDTLANCTVRSSYRLASCYKKHGTSVAIRIIVIDKAPGNTAPAIINRETVLELAPEIKISPRVEVTDQAKSPAASRPKKSTTSLFRAMRSKPRAKKPIKREVPSHNVIEIKSDKLETPRPLGAQKGVYLPYRPSRIDIAGAKEHPTPLVESVAMGSIPAPIPDSAPQIHERIIERGILSEAQLETLIYAENAWDQYLPGRFTPNEKGVALSLSEGGQKYRKGYFLGDGTGAGKGRQIAGCILSNWLAGRKRAIWISKNGTLLEDARRDWEALGGLSADIQPLSNWKIDEEVSFRNGILFVTYPTLRSQRQEATRLQQILNWAGSDFDGVLAFDESHEMGGVAGGEGARGKKDGSLQGIAGVLLQNHIPEARVIYASATGASDVNNLAYAVRLGLWGPGTAFSNREDFISQIRSGGIAAMELVSRDLKALGLYQARALSFAGVEYEILKHELDQEQIEIYDTYADAWAVIHQNMEKALELTGVVDDIEGETLNSQAKGAARSRFESSKQRFFCSVLLSMKLPTLIAAIDQHLHQKQSVVVQLVSTAESILNRRLDSLSPEERANLDIDLSPRENIAEYLQRAFPTQQQIIFTDDTGNQRSQPMFDENGQPVHNQQAEEAKARLLEHICALPPIRPALDGIIEHYGTDQVAEVTGRTKRLVNQADGSQKLETRSQRTNQSETDQFMTGRKRILVFSDAGGTGRSYHASLDVENKQQRVHFLVEPGWRADRAIQGLGRTHRTHQAATPLFRPVTTDCKGELRFTSTIARRLDSLGALTRGQRQTGGQNLFDPADNLESEYAKAALVTWYTLLCAGKLESTTLLEFQKRTGLTLTGKDGVMVEDLPPIQRWLNRILALPIAMQNDIFDEFLGLVEARVSAARDAGSLDVGVETIIVESAEMVEDRLLKTDERSGATSHLLSIRIERKTKIVSLDYILELKEWARKPKFLINRKSGRVALQEQVRSLMTETGQVIPRVVLNRPHKREYKLEHEMQETAWEPCSKKVFGTKWSEEAKKAEGHISSEIIHMASGLLLPIWSELPEDHLAVNRIVDKEGNSWLGRIIFDADIPGILKRFNIEEEFQIDGAAIMNRLRSSGSIRIDNPFPMTVKKSLVAKEQRIEITGNFHGQLDWLKSLGCFTEIIAFKTRIFVPVNSAEEIINKIIETG